MTGRTEGHDIPPPGETVADASRMPASAVLRRLVRIGAPPWGRLALAGVLGVAAALATVGLLAGSGYVVDRAAFRPGLGAIAGLLAIVEVLAFLRGPLRYGERLISHDAAFRALARWRVWLYDYLEPRSPAGLRAWRSGDVLSRLTDDVDVLQDLYVRGLVPVATTVAAATLAVVVVAVILPVAGWMLAACLLMAMATTSLLAVVTGPTGDRPATLRGTLVAEVVDLVQGAPDLLAFGAETELLERVEAADRALTRWARRRAWATGSSSAAIVVFAGAAVIGTLAAGIAAVRRGRMEPVMLAVLPLAAAAAFESVPALATAAQRTREVVAAGRRLFALAAVPVPVEDPSRPDPMPEGRLAVALDDASLRYRDDLPWALHHLDLTVDPGGRTALVGASGAGKTSVVNVLLRFWPLTSGSASLGGVPLDRLSQADVRRRVTLVDQDARLFAGTIRQNVRLGRPDADEASVAEAVRSAHLHEWVAQLPDGLDTPVGEGGVRVWGDSVDRVALARALLVDPSVLVLDEPTAGLDASAGASLLADLLAASSERTVLLVTHREQDLAGFDRVVVMERGRVIAG